MTWQALPLAGMVAAIAVPLLILLYFLKLRRRTQTIASTLLWKKSIEDLRANAPFQRLRRNLLLLIQLLVLAAIILAIARPMTDQTIATGSHIVIMMDRSRSMNVVDPGEQRSRLELAREEAIRLVESLPAPGLFSTARGAKPPSIMVIGFAEQAKLYSNFTVDRKQVVDAIRAIQPTDGRTKMGEALTLTRAFSRSVEAETRGRQIADPATIELFTDGNIADIGDQVIEGETVRYHRMGSPETRDNLAVVALDAERLYDRPTDLAIYTTLANYADAEVTSDVQFSLDGTPVHLSAVSIPAARLDEESQTRLPGTRGASFTIPGLARGGTIEIAILRDDVLDADNVATLVAPPPKRARVAAVVKGVSLRDALGVLPIDLVTLTEAELEDQVRSGAIASYDVVVLEDIQPETTITQGRFLTFGRPPRIEGLESQGEGGRTIPVAWDRRHPALRNVELDPLQIMSHQMLGLGEDMQTVIDGLREPLGIQISRGPLQALVIAFRPDQSSWYREASYIVFLADAIAYLADRGEAATQRSIAPGEAVTVRLPRDASNIRLSTPNAGGDRTWRAEDPTSISFGPIERTGVYRWRYMSGGEAGERLVAANLFDQDESAVTPSDLRLLSNAAVTQADTRGDVRRELWPWLLALALLIMMFEWWVYNRRVYL
jgi:Mg-chelatase subunit ChlD